MAITKIIPGVLDLNQANSESGLRMPTGGAFSGSPLEAMMRNDDTQTSQGSASTMQHYNGSTWKNFINKTPPPPNPYAADIYLDPDQLPSSGTITEWANSGTNGQVATVYGNSGTISVDTFLTAKCAKATYGAGNSGFAMNPSGTTGLNKYSLYNTQQSFSYYGFMAADSTYNTALEYPKLFQIGETTGANVNDYANTVFFDVIRAGAAGAGYVNIAIYNTTPTAILGTTTTQTAEFGGGIGYYASNWTGVGLVHEYDAAGTTNVKCYVNGALVHTYGYVTSTSSFGQSSNSLGFGISYYPNYNYAGMYYGDIQYWANTAKTDSEISTIHDYFKADYGL